MLGSLLHSSNTQHQMKEQVCNLGVSRGWSDTLVTVSAPWEKVD